MQTRDEFVAGRRQRWQELENLLVDKELHRLPPITISRIASLYRMICTDLMRARALGLGSDVTGHLDALAGRTHNVLYGPKPYRFRGIAELVTSGFPRALRKNWRFFALSNALFYLPFVVGLVGALGSSEFAEGVLPGSALRSMEEAYSTGFEKGRDVGQDSTMAGFYVYNNVGIAFRCFATGMLFGFGSMFFLVYNGLMMGTVLGHVIGAGHGANILTFVCGHGPFELTAIVISGGAGLQMGWALVQTHGRSRVASLQAQAPDLFRLISGAAIMLVIAAAVEAFWSPSSIPPPVKWGFSGFASVLVTLYLLLGGRSFRRRPEPEAAGQGSDRAPESRRSIAPSSRGSLPPSGAA